MNRLRQAVENSPALSAAARRAYPAAAKLAALPWMAAFCAARNVNPERLVTPVRRFGVPMIVGRGADVDGHMYNGFYGNARWIKRYAGFSSNTRLDAAIEHGIVFDRHVSHLEKNGPKSVILTFGEHRKKVWGEVSDKRVVPIGPYIHYAPDGGKRAIAAERKRLGKNLLVFPAHSTHWLETSYDWDRELAVLERLKERFDSVRICLYWKDIRKGSSLPYQQRGFACVTAGHMFDPWFLPRLRTLIAISDMTASNFPGTHVGYSLWLGRPHYIYEAGFQQENPHPEKTEFRSDFADNEDILRVSGAFGRYGESISTDQWELADYYWGFSRLKNRKEMARLLSPLMAGPERRAR